MFQPRCLALTAGWHWTRCFPTPCLYENSTKISPGPLSAYLWAAAGALSTAPFGEPPAPVPQPAAPALAAARSKILGVQEREAAISKGYITHTKPRLSAELSVADTERSLQKCGRDLQEADSQQMSLLLCSIAPLAGLLPPFRCLRDHQQEPHLQSEAARPLTTP